VILLRIPIGYTNETLHEKQARHPPKTIQKFVMATSTRDFVHSGLRPTPHSNS